MTLHVGRFIIASLAVAGCAFSETLAGNDTHAGTAAKPFAKPNIVVILADDMGVGDVHGLYPEHSKIPTPNLDRLATQGMTFTDAHSGSAVCSPTRYGLLTGRYAWRTSLRTSVLGAYDPPLIAEDCLTLPAMLQQQGYTTACIGKWHLGWNWPFSSPQAASKLSAQANQGKSTAADFDWDKPITGGPVDHGFDYYFGTHVPNQPPYCFIENRHTVGMPSAMVDCKTLPTHYCIGIPGPMLPGWKFDEILPKLDERVVQYLGERARDKKPFFLYFAMTAPHEPVAPSKQWQGKSGINPIADFIMETDGVVGDVLQALKKNGLSDNTLVIFTADNGHGPAPIKGLEELLKHGHQPSGPFRGYKADIWEGGHRVPFIARWPGKIKAGSTCNDVICLTDLMATSADLAGAKLPDNAAVDSVNILPDLLGMATGPACEATVHQGINGGLAIRQGKWKLEFCPGSNGFGILSSPTDAQARKQGLPPVQLCDMSQDEGERKNVEAEHPEIVERLTKLLQQYIDDGRSTPGPKQKNDVPVKIVR